MSKTLCVGRAAEATSAPARGSSYDTDDDVSDDVPDFNGGTDSASDEDSDLSYFAQLARQ